MVEVNERQFYQHGNIIFVLLKLRVTKMLSLNKKWYHWKKELIGIGNSHMFWTGQNYAFSMSVRYIIEQYTEQFDQICLDYGYRLVESVVNMRIICRITLQVSLVNWQQTFIRSNFIRTTKSKFAQESFSIPGTFDA